MPISKEEKTDIHTFLSFIKVVFARQAWIQADANRYNGANEEVLWTTFAKYGLGVGAANYTDSSSLPSHYKPIVTYRAQTKLPPLVGTDICGVAAGSVVIVKVNPQTIATLFGVRLFVSF